VRTRGLGELNDNTTRLLHQLALCSRPPGCRRNASGELMIALILALLASVPVVVAYHFVTRVPALAILIFLMNLTVGVYAGAAFGWFSSRRNRDLSITKLIAGSVICGIVVTTVQYAVAFEAGSFAIFGPFWGAFLGGAGAAVYLALERAVKGKEDASREARYHKMIEDQSNKDETD